MMKRRKIDPLSPRAHSVLALKLGYILALTFIALLVVMNWYMSNTLIKTQAISAARVNVSGRQRMLSQELAFLSLELTDELDAANRQAIRQQMFRTLEQMKVNHEALFNGNPSMNLPAEPLPPAIEERYFYPPVNLRAQLFRYLGEAEALMNTPDQELSKTNAHLIILLEMREPFRNALNENVDLYQQDSEADIAKIKTMGTRVTAIIIFVLWLEAIVVFRPLVNTVQKEQRRLTDSNQELHNLSSLDGLTGIPNRRTFDSFYSQEWKNAVKTGNPLAVIMGDIDYFKFYNDTYGHQQGDECLKTVAQTLSAAVKRKEDLLARYGGEEFVIVLPNTDEKGAAAVAELLRASVEAIQLKHESSKVIPFVTMSFGVAVRVKPTVEGEEHVGQSFDLLKSADVALYQAKQEGRNRVIITHLLTFDNGE